MIVSLVVGGVVTLMLFICLVGLPLYQERKK